MQLNINVDFFITLLQFRYDFKRLNSLAKSPLHKFLHVYTYSIIIL